MYFINFYLISYNFIQLYIHRELAQKDPSEWINATPPTEEELKKQQQQNENDDEATHSKSKKKQIIKKNKNWYKWFRGNVLYSVEEYVEDDGLNKTIYVWGGMDSTEEQTQGLKKRFNVL